MDCWVRILPMDIAVQISRGERLLSGLRRAGVAPDAPCGGNGTCGKCLVKIDGQWVRACGYTVESDITVELPLQRDMQIPGNIAPLAMRTDPVRQGCLAAVDIGTTSVVCTLMSADGVELAVHSAANPQCAYGADVVSRIRLATEGQGSAMTTAIRKKVKELLLDCCADASVEADQVGVIALVGNPCMQQLFLGIPLDNLARVPFKPAVSRKLSLPAREYLEPFENALLVTPGNISGFVGSDTVGCMIAGELYMAEDTVLLVDIGTNGEMALRHGGRTVVCSTAAGPALEGANISRGMRAETGAVDHVFFDGFHVIGNTDPRGICGSGLVDAVAVMLDKKLLNKRGRILTEDRSYDPVPGVTLNQEDIRQVQLAKGAIAAGIRQMTAYLGITPENIDRCLLAGAFGSCMDPRSACRIGLLPAELKDKTYAMGNLALQGAKMLAADRKTQEIAEQILEETEYLELASMPEFPRIFAKSMTFEEAL